MQELKENWFGLLVGVIVVALVIARAI